MTKLTDSLYVIHNNPFIMAPLFTNFFDSVTESENNYLFCYLLLPLVLNVDRRDFLNKSTVRSSVHTFKNKQNLLIGLADDVQYYSQSFINKIQYF